MEGDGDCSLNFHDALHEAFNNPCHLVFESFFSEDHVKNPVHGSILNIVDRDLKSLFAEQFLTIQITETCSVELPVQLRSHSRTQSRG